MGSGLSINEQKWYKLVNLCKTDINGFLEEMYKCSSSVLNMVVAGKNILIIACVYQPYAVSHLLNCKKFTTQNINMITGCGSALFYACKYQPDAVQYLLNSTRFTDESINVVLIDQCNALHYAFMASNGNSVKYLLESERFSKSNVNMLKGNYYSVLHIACISNNYEGVWHLMKSPKFSRNIVNSVVGYSNSNFFLYACHRSPKIASDIIMLCDELKPDTLNALETHNKNALHLACENNDDVLVACLLTNPNFTDENINGVDEEGSNALFYACRSQESKISVIKQLLDSNRFLHSSIEHKNLKKKSIIDWACLYSNVSVVKFLLDSDKITKDFVHSHNFISKYENEGENKNLSDLKQQNKVRNIIFNHPKCLDLIPDVYTNQIIMDHTLAIEQLERKFSQWEKEINKSNTQYNTEMY